jgi:hypothetical protein
MLGITQVTFEGRSRVGVKREVLVFWNRNRARLGLSLREFLSNCRMSGDDCHVVFTFPAVDAHKLSQ